MYLIKKFTFQKLFIHNKGNRQYKIIWSWYYYINSLLH